MYAPDSRSRGLRPESCPLRFARSLARSCAAPAARLSKAVKESHGQPLAHRIHAELWLAVSRVLQLSRSSSFPFVDRSGCALIFRARRLARHRFYETGRSPDLTCIRRVARAAPPHASAGVVLPLSQKARSSMRPLRRPCGRRVRPSDMCQGGRMDTRSRYLRKAPGLWRSI